MLPNRPIKHRGKECVVIPLNELVERSLHYGKKRSLASEGLLSPITVEKFKSKQETYQEIIDKYYTNYPDVWFLIKIHIYNSIEKVKKNVSKKLSSVKRSIHTKPVRPLSTGERKDPELGMVSDLQMEPDEVFPKVTLKDYLRELFCQPIDSEEIRRTRVSKLPPSREAS